MDKEVRSIIEYYKVLDIKLSIDKLIKRLFISIGISLILLLLINPMAIRSCVRFACGILIFPVFFGFVFSSIVKIYEKNNNHLLESPQKIVITSIDDTVELLRKDMNIHNEVIKEISSDKNLFDTEVARYDCIRRLHYNIWFIQSELENDEFRRKQTTHKEVEEYLEKQTKIKDELLFIFNDNEEVQGMILEQYNRIRTKTLVWPKVVSKE